MKPAARITDPHGCPAHGGGPILPPGSPNVRIGGLAAARATDLAQCNGPPDMVMQGAISVRINGLPAARFSDPMAHGGGILGGFPSVLIGGPTGPGEGIGTGLSLDDNPETVIVAPELCKEFSDAMGRSFPGGTSREQGGTLVRDPAGNLSVFIGSGNGDSGAFTPDRDVSPGYTIVGIFHTHPYDRSEGGHTNVSLSGGDAAYMINNGDEFIFAQSGGGQFMYLRTQDTPAQVDPKDLNESQNARISELMKKGNRFNEASRIAARETAKSLGLAYYEGSNCKLGRVVP